MAQRRGKVTLLFAELIDFLYLLRPTLSTWHSVATFRFQVNV